MKPRWIVILLLCSILLVGCSSETGQNKVDNNIFENEFVKSVKNGTSFTYPEVTYAEAFHSFFANPTWRYFNGTQDGPDEDGDGTPDYYVENVKVVEFTGSCTYLDVEVEALIQFVVGEETFEAEYLSFNDVPQNMIMLNALIEKAFESYLENCITPIPESTQGDISEKDGVVEAPIVFTQVGLYDHNEFIYLSTEYIPKIFLYSDGSFEFWCKNYEGMELLEGWWQLEGEVPKTYHCYVMNYNGMDNLDFYLYHNEDYCDAEFYSDYNEFGMTSANDVLFHLGEIEYDEVSEADSFYTDIVLDDMVKYKISAADNAEEFAYKDILRNPEKYIGNSFYVKGTVSNKNGDSYLVTNSKGESFWINPDYDCANVINEDSCTVFGEITGTDYNGTLVYLDAKCVLVGNDNNLTQEEREKERIYSVYTWAGDEFFALTKEQFIREQYRIFSVKSIVSFYEKIVQNGTEGYRVTVQFAENEHEDLTGFFEPWERKITWDWELGRHTSNVDFGICWYNVPEELRNEKMEAYLSLPAATPTPTEISIPIDDSENDFEDEYYGEDSYDEGIFCGYDCNGDELYTGYMIRIGADMYGEKHIVGTITGTVESGEIQVTFTEYYDTEQYGQFDYYYLDGVIEEIVNNGFSVRNVWPDNVQIYIFG